MLWSLMLVKATVLIAGQREAPRAEAAGQSELQTLTVTLIIGRQRRKSTRVSAMDWSVARCW